MSGTKLGIAVSVFCLLLLAMAAENVTVAEDRHTGVEHPFLLQASVFSSGGAPGVSPMGYANGTLGQSTPLGVGSSGNRILRSGFWAWTRGLTSGFEEDVAGVSRSSLYRAIPNPFRHSTGIEYAVANEVFVEMSVYNVRGQAVRGLVGEVKVPGRHVVFWNGRDDSGDELSAGIYFCCMSAGESRFTRKMLVVR